MVLLSHPENRVHGVVGGGGNPSSCNCSVGSKENQQAKGQGDYFQTRASSLPTVWFQAIRESHGTQREKHSGEVKCQWDENGPLQEGDALGILLRSLSGQSPPPCPAHPPSFQSPIPLLSFHRNLTLPNLRDCSRMQKLIPRRVSDLGERERRPCQEEGPARWKARKVWKQQAFS